MSRVRNIRTLQRELMILTIIWTLSRISLWVTVTIFLFRQDSNSAWGMCAGAINGGIISPALAKKISSTSKILKHRENEQPN